MGINIQFQEKINESISIAVLAKEIESIRKHVSGKEYAFIKERFDKKEKVISINRLDSVAVFIFINTEVKPWRNLEQIRLAGNTAIHLTEQYNHTSLQLVKEDSTDEAFIAFAEGVYLGTYKFNKYKTGNNSIKKTVESILIVANNDFEKKISEIINIAKAVFVARDWVNEPVIELGAPEFASQIEEKAQKAGLNCVVNGKQWIENENMGGLLAVNYGSLDEPRFTILEWAPENAINTKPLVLVGKGIVYDTGGISLKPSASMEWMKADMGGASAIAGAMLAIAENKLPVRVIALIPSTDNRPGQNAYVPGDVIKMRSGKTVEVLNTDAEGRMILADGLDYAEGYSPDLVIDMATLTGAAAAAVGDFAAVTMGTAEDSTFETLEKAGYAVCERIVRFPFWDEYGDMIKSDIADIKNIGGPVGGAITAGKFLEHFTKSPWVHIDISGSAFLKTNEGYRGKGGTGFGVRLLYNFIKSHYIK